MPAEFTNFISGNLPWVVALAIAVAVSFSMGRSTRRAKPRLGRRSWHAWKTKRDRPDPQLQIAKNPAIDQADMLRHVTAAKFSVRPLLNKSERRLFATLERAVHLEAPEWRVMAQVSLGEILATPCELAFRAINSKRVDFLLIRADSHPLHAIEYHGGGHYQGTAAVRDAVKREALRRAGIGYSEVVPGDTPDDVRGLLRKLSARYAP